MHYARTPSGGLCAGLHKLRPRGSNLKGEKGTAEPQPQPRRRSRPRLSTSARLAPASHGICNVSCRALELVRLPRLLTVTSSDAGKRGM